MTKVSTYLTFNDVTQFIIDNPSRISEIMEVCKEHRLTDRELAILKYIHTSFQEHTSPSIAKRFDLSIQASSNYLTNLFKRGYLMRRDVGDPSGGIMFEYELTHKGFKYVK